MTTILLLDDNSDILSLLEMVLNQQGYEVMSGRNGREGMDILKQGIFPDLIISNFHMPQMDGLDFLEHLRENPRFRTIPFILLTAAPPVQWQQQASLLGANAFLPKPFKIDLLKKTIRAVSEASDSAACAH
ncbi:MAG: response regulator [Anaerolineaceae bacterium]|nr:response regulator [Anaerolineaceae bacterium]